MEHFLQQLHTIKNQISFDPERKKTMRSHLAHFIEADIALRERSQPVGVFATFFRKPVAAFIAIAVLLVAGGETSLAAQGALPGDALYGVKVGINEKIAGAFQFTAEAKAAYEADLAIRRLDEADALAERGELSSEDQAELEERFADHSDRARKGIAEIQTQGNVIAAANLATQFEIELRAHDRLLAQADTMTFTSNPAREETASKPSGEAGGSAMQGALSAQGDEQAKNSNGSSGVPTGMASGSSTSAQIETDRRLGTRVRKVLTEIGGLRAEIESEIEVHGTGQEEGLLVEARAAAQAKIASASRTIGAVLALAQEKRPQMSAEAAANIDAKIQAANSALAEASVKMNAQAFGEAFNLGNRAIRAAEEARIILQTKSSLQIEEKLDSGSSSGMGTSIEFQVETGHQQELPSSTILKRDSGEDNSHEGESGSHGGSANMGASINTTIGL